MAALDRRGGSRFRLTKWYFDCVAPDGRVVIGYWSSLAWRRLALTWQSVAMYEPGRPPVRRSSLVSAPEPEAAEGVIVWRAHALDCLMRVESRQPPFDARLLDGPTGFVEWRAEAPAALVSAELSGCAPVHGTGYAERSVITVPPWRLPIRELRWGRWIDRGGTRSVVWIDWRGDSPRTWVFVDGVRAPSATVTDDRVCAAEATVVLGERRTLDAQSFADIAATIPPLEAVAPKSLLALRQTRWCSAGTLREGSAAEIEGHAIHELVVWR